MGTSEAGHGISPPCVNLNDESVKLVSHRLYTITPPSKASSDSRRRIRYYFLDCQSSPHGARAELKLAPRSKTVVTIKVPLGSADHPRLHGLSRDSQSAEGAATKVLLRVPMQAVYQLQRRPNRSMRGGTEMFEGRMQGVSWMES